jgi:hypothetical protein
MELQVSTHSIENLIEKAQRVQVYQDGVAMADNILFELRRDPSVERALYKKTNHPVEENVCYEIFVDSTSHFVIEISGNHTIIGLTVM